MPYLIRQLQCRPLVKKNPYKESEKLLIYPHLDQNQKLISSRGHPLPIPTMFSHYHWFIPAFSMVAQWIRRQTWSQEVGGKD